MNAGQVAVVAHDAGGAEILSSLVRRMDADARSRYVFVLEGPARAIFSAKLGPVKQLPLSIAVQQSSWVLCGSGWQSDLEVNAIALARAEGRRSAVFLDHWLNYPERFTRGGQVHLPDELWVGDEIALGVARAAFPQLPVTLVENPYFLDVRDEFRRRGPAPAPSGGLSVLFVCEPVREHALRQHGDERHWGYTEEDALRYFLDHADVLPQPIARIVVRRHPAEAPGKYAQLLSAYDLPIEMSEGRSLFDDISDSHWVVGCNSMAMVVALESGRQVLSCIPPGGRACLLPQREIRSLRSLIENRAT